MGGCQSYSSSDEEANHNNISLFKIKNNSLHMMASAEVKPYLRDHFLSRRITDVDLLTLSAHPHGLDQQEWIATNTVAFFQHVTLLFSALSDFCSTTACPTAKSSRNILYEWTDEQGKKLKCSAPLYIDYAMSYIQELLADERVFPTRAYSSFPPGFMFLIQKVFVMLFRTLAHLFSAHYHDAIVVELHPHLNTLFTHFITFGHTFRLLDPAETAPIDDLIAGLTH
ncbi:MOB kinase activator 2-like [Xyrauchen texanus]|uniref:MOB kinase activator 2-like n=1 Tax=Xyrauchen texanus TaxID=154827 RepID=UPI0022427F97|nr:MOB kinase activator 2-like [Xyrauchen texanus]